MPVKSIKLFEKGEHGGQSESALRNRFEWTAWGNCLIIGLFLSWVIYEAYCYTSNKSFELMTIAKDALIKFVKANCSVASMSI